MTTKMMKERSTAFFQMLSENAFDILTVLSEDAIIEFESNATERILGYPAGNRERRKVFDFVHPDDIERLLAVFEDLKQDPEGSRICEFRYRHQRGHWLWMEARGRNMLSHPEIQGILVNSRDITQRKQKETALKESKEKYERLFHNSSSLLMEVDAASFEIVSCNPAMAKSLNKPAKELIGQNIRHIFPENVFQKRLVYAQKALQENQVQQFEDTRKGRWFLNNFIPVFTEGGKYIQTVTYDITERKKAEQALKESEEKHKFLTDHSADVIYQMDLQKGRYTYISPAVQHMFGYTQAEAAELDPWDVLTKESNEKQAALFGQDMAKGVTSRTYEVDAVHKDGHVFPMETHATLLFDANGNPTGVLGIVRDITERKKVEQALKASEEKYRNLFQFMEEGFLRADEHGMITLANSKISAKYGFDSPDEVIGLPVKALYFNPSERDIMFEHLNRQGILRNYEILGRTKEGNSFWTSCSIKALRNSKGQIVGSEAIVRDINELKKAQEALKESEAHYRELNAVKDKLFSIISHDLRNPFSSILGFSQVAKKKLKNKEYEALPKYLDLIYNATKQSYSLLENLLQWSRVQTGRVDFSPEHLNLKALVDKTTNLLEPSLKEKSIDLTVDLDDQTTAYADEFMLETIFRNLLTNAVKYTHQQGAIEIRAQQHHTGTEVVVTDNGVGINAEDQEKLFHMDTHYTTAGTQQEKGSGLGLVLCKEFVEMHRGRIWAESEKGKGTAFHFTLPRPATDS